MLSNEQNGDASPKRRKVLIVDDDFAIRQILARLTSNVADSKVVETGEQALEVAGSWNPDLVLLDILLPQMNGYQVCRELKSNWQHPNLQVIMVSGRSSDAELAEAFDAGADDYLVKPLDPAELRSRIELHFRLLDAKRDLEQTQAKIDSKHADLREKLLRRDQQVSELQNIAVFTLAKIADSRDNQTGEHLIRLREYAQCLAEHVGQTTEYSAEIDSQFLSDLHRATPLHDIGKVGIPDSILLKPGPLDENEYNIMKRHATIGGNLIQETINRFEDCHFLEMAADVAMYHHERWDGRGYPEGISGTAIPLAARIVAIADVFDALTNSRPYKEAWSFDRAFKEILAGRGTQFDPVLVDSFVELRPEIQVLAQKNALSFPELTAPMPPAPTTTLQV